MTIELTGILENVEALYDKFGIKSVTMDDIARELGMSKKTLYQFFKDKRDLVNKAAHYSFSKKRELFDAILAKDLNAIHEIYEIYYLLHKLITEFSTTNEYDLKKYYPNIYKEIKELRKSEIERFLMQNILKGKKQDIYRSKLNEIIISKYQSAIIANISENEMLAFESTFSESFLFEIINYHLHAIVNEKGLKELHKLDKLKQ